MEPSKNRASGQAPKPLIYAPPPEPGYEVLHKDDRVLAVSKASGLLSVPGKPAEHADCLEFRVRKAFPDARIVHRLDMDTSGVMVLALTPAAHRHLGLQFERRKTEKTYVARVWGDVAGSEGRIDQPLICDWPNRPRQMICLEHGKSAVTDWSVISRDNGSTRLLLKPLTGRSHQLRVHLLSLGHPILGDNLYAHPEALHAAERLQLHAQSLTLHHPDGGERITFQAECSF